MLKKMNNSFCEMDSVRMYLLLSVIGFLCASIHCQNYFTRSDIMEGLSFPHEVRIISGEDLFIKIVKPVTGQTKCEFRSPGNGDLDVASIDSNNKIKRWATETCGIQVTNISLSDAGAWRITSSNTTASFTTMARGISLVEVIENNLEVNTPNQLYSPFEDVTPEGTRYCYVLRPNEENSEFPQHGECMIPDIGEDLDANGKWKVIAGVDGKTEEHVFEISVDVKAEKLDAAVEHDDQLNKIHFKCNLINSKKIVTFCRFLRLADNVGFNMDEGIGNSIYRYHGNGIDNQECGLTISEPTDADRTVWKCFIGYTEGSQIRTMGAILDASDTVIDPGDEITVENVYALNGTAVKILCKAKHALDYCWFTHPAGQRIAVSDMTVLGDDDIYQYYGTGLKLGDCGIKIMDADISDSGLWTCHAGNIEKSRIESQKEFIVRVSDSHLVASSVSRDVLVSNPIMIECTTIPINLPVEYCRFVMPDGTGFSINEDVTSDKALLDNYYFNPNRNRQDGFCSLIVRHATLDHSGLWTCAGKVSGRNSESLDDFTVFVEKNKLSAASLVGMVLGGVFIFAGVIAIGVHGYKRRRQRLLDDTNEANDSNRLEMES